MPIVEKKDDGSILIHTGKRVGHHIELGPPVWLAPLNNNSSEKKPENPQNQDKPAPLAPPAPRATSK